MSDRLPGWYRDPEHNGAERFWNGIEWTEQDRQGEAATRGPSVLVEEDDSSLVRVVPTPEEVAPFRRRRRRKWWQKRRKTVI